MNDLTLLSMFWVVVGAVAMFFVERRAKERGLIEGIKLHHEGRLTYTTYTEGGSDMIDIEIAPLKDMTNE